MWRAAMGPDVLISPVLYTIAAGGGRCVVDPSGEALPRFETRSAAIRAAFR